MIHIKDILPFGASSAVQLSSVLSAYYDRVTPAGKASPLTEVRTAVTARRNSRTVKRRQRDFLEWVDRSYRDLLIGDPNQLVALAQVVDTNGWTPLLWSGTKLTKFGEEVERIFGYERSRFKPVRKWLAEQLNIKSCPYCNAQYTLVVNDSDNETVVKFQFDHFFSKKRYPYLSVSLYNLIPACANCNLAKSDGTTALDTHYHPYDSALASSARFSVKWNKGTVLSSLPELLKLKPGDIEITFVPKFSDRQALVTAHDKMFDITGVYRRHTDIVQELLGKAVLYDKHYRDAVDKIEGLFPDRHVMLRYILGNYMEEERILDRPLAKFTQDIAESLGLIEPR